MEGPKLCKRCKGTNYVFNPDPDVFWDAVRAKGWKLSVDTGIEGGDSIVVWNAKDIDCLSFIAGVGGEDADVLEDEGLRGQALLQTALHRAMEAA